MPMMEEKEPDTFGLRGCQCGILCTFDEDGTVYHVALERSGGSKKEKERKAVRECRIYRGDQIVSASVDEDLSMSAPIAYAKLTEFLGNEK